MKSNYQIIVDTREQRPLWKKTIFQKLDVGDYSFKHNEIDFSNIIAIERKSLSDLFGTLGQGHLRFKKEISKALNLSYFAIVIDGSLTQIITKKFDGGEFIKMKGETISKILFTLHLKYGINVFFSKGRNDSKRIIKSIFESFIAIDDINRAKNDI